MAEGHCRSDVPMFSLKRVDVAVGGYYRCPSNFQYYCYRVPYYNNTMKEPKTLF